jgi:hypothetical protein
MNTPARKQPPQIGVNIDGVLHRDSEPTLDSEARFRMVAAAGVFDYIEKNPAPGEDLRPCIELVERFGVPIAVIGGIFRAGRDEARMREIAEWGGRFGAGVYNCQLFADHADGHRLSDEEVADFYLRMCDSSERHGCLGSFEVHVDMWSEDFRRVASVAERVTARGARFRITLDHSHLLFKIGNAQELDVSGIRGEVERGEIALDPASPAAIFKQWIAAGWVHHAHARSVIPNNPPNAAMRRPDGRHGRGIQYPFLRPAAGEWAGEWQQASLETWKLALRQLMESRARSGLPARISCEFIPFPDYGGGARYSIFDNNVACARWLRDTWSGMANS